LKMRKIQLYSNKKQQAILSNFEEMDRHVQMDLQSKFENLQVRKKGSKIGAQACGKQEKF
ncbi:4016_t:CDS:1, partial [Gigaspora rosea]